MNMLEQNRDAFLKGDLNKSDYINRMHLVHSKLFDYVEFIKRTGIGEITINENGVYVTCRESGIKLYCDELDKCLAPLMILNMGAYEEKEMALTLKLLYKNKKRDDFVFFDIGANIGWYTLNVATRVPGIHAYAFEPIPKTFSYLERNVNLNLLKNVKIFNFGFSDEEKNSVFFYSSEHSGASSLANVVENSVSKESVQQVRCKLKTLDSFAKQSAKSIDFIKCDVEGAELFVLKGGLKTIQKDKPIIFLEMLRKWSAKFNYHPNEIISVLKTEGYSCFVPHEESLLPFNVMDEHTADTNFFFLHEKKHTF